MRKQGYWASAARLEHDGIRASWNTGFEQGPSPITTIGSSLASRKGAFLACLKNLEDGAFVHVSVVVGRKAALSRVPPIAQVMLEKSTDRTPVKAPVVAAGQPPQSLQECVKGVVTLLPNACSDTLGSSGWR